MTTKEVISLLKSKADPSIVNYKRSKFGIEAINAIGIYQKELNQLARQIPRDHELALKLFETNIYEARLLCSKLCDPHKVTLNQMDDWVQTFDNWEICDTFCLGVFAKHPMVVSKIVEWATHEKEFVKRAAFATIAGYCSADKTSNNDIFKSFFSIILRECTDSRVYVKKAINWALRSIGKRNEDLKLQAIQLANEILRLENKTANWIAKDTLRELNNPKVRISQYPRSIYKKT